MPTFTGTAKYWTISKNIGFNKYVPTNFTQPQKIDH